MKNNQNTGKHGEKTYRTSYYSAGCRSKNRSFSGKTLASKKLYRIPEEGMVKGVCAGIAYYFNVPVRLIRIIAVLSMFFGLFLFTLLAYGVLVLMLDELPASSYEDANQPTSYELLDQIEQRLGSSEQQLRHIERYVTSDTFGVQSRFRSL